LFPSADQVFAWLAQGKLTAETLLEVNGSGLPAVAAWWKHQLLRSENDFFDSGESRSFVFSVGQRLLEFKEGWQASWSSHTELDHPVDAQGQNLPTTLADVLLIYANKEFLQKIQKTPAIEHLNQARSTRLYRSTLSEKPLPFLHQAVMADSVEMVRWCLKQGGDANQSSPKGETPLFFVKSKEALSLLTAAGADLHHRDQEGCLATDAWTNEKLLRGAGGDPNASLLGENKTNLLLAEVARKEPAALSVGAVQRALANETDRQHVFSTNNATAVLYRGIVSHLNRRFQWNDKDTTLMELWIERGLRGATKRHSWAIGGKPTNAPFRGQAVGTLEMASLILSLDSPHKLLLGPKALFTWENLQKTYAALEEINEPRDISAYSFPDKILAATLLLPPKDLEKKITSTSPIASVMEWYLTVSGREHLIVFSKNHQQTQRELPQDAMVAALSCYLSTQAPPADTFEVAVKLMAQAPVNENWPKDHPLFQKTLDLHKVLPDSAPHWNRHSLWAAWVSELLRQKLSNGDLSPQEQKTFESVQVDPNTSNAGFIRWMAQKKAEIMNAALPTPAPLRAKPRF